MDGVSSAILSGPGGVLIPIGYAAVLDGDAIYLTFDLNEITLGSYTLIVNSGAEADTVEDAVVLYDEAVDLSRLTFNTAPEITPMISGPGTPPRIAV